MDKNFTHYIFQYTYFTGRSSSNLLNVNLEFDHEHWLSTRFKRLIDCTPELPDEIIKLILKKANVY
jgi:hypothetical protein